MSHLFPWQQPGTMISRTWPVAPTRQTLSERWSAFVATDVPLERRRYFAPSKTGRNIATRVAGMTPLSELGTSSRSEPIVRFGMRSFDRQWTFLDPRVAKTESPALWASLSERQVFMTTMTTTTLGRGPAATVTVAVPDKRHFCGSYGGKDVIPLYRDARGTPNVDPQLLTLLSRRLDTSSAGAPGVTVDRLFAYCFGVLAGTDYTDRFREELGTPGPRIPITSDPHLFARMSAHGERLLWLQSFGER